MNNQLEQNKLNAIAFYKTMFDGDPEKAIELYVGDEYRQHNPMVADGKAGIIEYFTRMKREYPIKKVRFVRAIAQGDLVALHTHQIGENQIIKNMLQWIFSALMKTIKLLSIGTLYKK